MDGIILAKAIIALTLKIANIIVHSIGIYILRCLQKNGRGDVQSVYILNLSITELIINVTSFLRNLMKMAPIEAFQSELFKTMVTYSYIVDYTVLKFILYMSMLAITLDRLFLVTLSVFYPLYWNRKKARVVVLCIWSFAISLCIVTSILYDSFK